MKRPLSLTIISILFIIVGIVSVTYHATDFKAQGPFQYDLIGILLVRLLALVCGIFMLRARNWARWLLVAWLLFHVVVSGIHSPSALVVHGLLLGIIAYFLFRPPASAYFRNLPVTLTNETAAPK